MYLALSAKVIIYSKFVHFEAILENLKPEKLSYTGRKNTDY